MQILKISHGKDFFSNEYDDLINKELACVHADTKAKGQSHSTQFEFFKNAKKGDVFYICFSNDSVDVIGMFIDERPLIDPDDEMWIYRKYETLFKAVNSNDYDKSAKKWWLPGNNSTCIIIKDFEIPLFQEKILAPVFNKNITELQFERNEALKKRQIKMEDILKLQKEFKKYSEDEISFLTKLNSLDIEDKQRLLYEYNNIKKIDRQPVVLCRKKVVEKLLEGQIDKSIINSVKDEVAKKFPKSVFKSWKSNFKLLYTLLYAEHKKELIDKLNTLAIKLQNDLGLVEKTKIKIVHLDGARNQGNDVIWLAIYNNSHISQKTAKQLFFKINDVFEYGLLDYSNLESSDLRQSEVYDYEKILNHLRSFIKTIENDNVNSSSETNDILDLLDFKKQIILQGPPGTGKTRLAKEIAAKQLLLEDVQQLKYSDQFQIIQFHPSYSYEDFVRGIVAHPTIDGKGVLYTAKDKLLAEFALRALEDDKNSYVLIIDEINRANLSAVLGELIYALEYRDEEVTSMYSVMTEGEEDSTIVLPSNLYIIGTMNTADRSVGHIDYAIQRRFAFVDVLPQELNNDDTIVFHKELFKKISLLFVENYDEYISNDKIPLKRAKTLSEEFRVEDVWLGHSYFIQKILEEGTLLPQDFRIRINYEIKPILLQYEKDGILIGEYDGKSVKDYIKSL